MALKTVYIYALSDPNTDEVRYIGKTTNLRSRYRSHINRAKRGSEDNHKSRWIRRLLAHNLEPLMHIIDEVDVSVWEEAERDYIALYRAAGHALTNLTDGGAGMSGWTAPPEFCDAIRQRQIGRKLSPAWVAALSAGNRGKKLSPETIAKIVAKNKGKKRSPDFCAQSSARTKGRRLSAETRAKISAIQKANPHTPPAGWKHTPEARAKMSEAAKRKFLDPEMREKYSQAQKARHEGNAKHLQTPETQVKRVP